MINANKIYVSLKLIDGKYFMSQLYVDYCYII